MAFRVVATAVSRPVPDQLRIDYRLEDGSTVPPTLVDTGSVTMTFPFDGAHSPAQRQQAILDTFRDCVRGRVQGMRAAAADFEAIKSIVTAGKFAVTEAD